jgi:hypothetical protein
MAPLPLILGGGAFGAGMYANEQQVRCRRASDRS